MRDDHQSKRKGRRSKKVASPQGVQKPEAARPRTGGNEHSKGRVRGGASQKKPVYDQPGRSRRSQPEVEHQPSSSRKGDLFRGPREGSLSEAGPPRVEGGGSRNDRVGPPRKDRGSPRDEGGLSAAQRGVSRKDRDDSFRRDRGSSRDEGGPPQGERDGSWGERGHPREEVGRAPIYRPDRDVVRVHGYRAAAAAVKNRPAAVVRAYVDEAHAATYGDMMRVLATHRVAYRLLPSEEMVRVAGSGHHEGICLLVKPRSPPDIETWLRSCPAAASAIVLDDVRNPHNLGAIIRMAAHFGVVGVWSTGLVPNHGALARVAEGGAESVDIFQVTTTAVILPRLHRAGFEIVAASPKAKTSLYAHRFPRRVAFVLGAEQQGLSEQSAALVDLSLTVPGTGTVESLNVSMAAAIFVSEYARQRTERSRRPARPGAPSAMPDRSE
ncbi:MAG: hypothetical protein KTR25_18085 [Myxococcales bacterium]|nr:hypothetical protein [Myxococcales bacterium]